MGLGGIAEVKKLIPEWFPTAKLTPEQIGAARRAVGVVVEDLSVKINNIGTVAHNIRRLKSDVQKHAPRTFAKFPRCSVLVSLVDDSKHTPAAKVPEQKSRARRPHLEGGDLAELGRLSYVSQHGLDVGAEEAVLTNVLGDRVRVSAKGKPRGTVFHAFMGLLLGTRSRKVDTAHFFTREMLRSPPETFSLFGVPRTLVIDGAVWPPNGRRWRLQSGDEADVDLRDALLYDCTRSGEYDTCALEMDQQGTRRIAPGARPLRGEADIKIVAWLREHVPLLEAQAAVAADRGEDPPALWVDCVDTDLIPILLLWARELIDPATGRMRFRLLLDCTSRKSAKGKEKNLSDEEKALLQQYPALDHEWVPSVEVYDITELWRQLHTTFQRVFPGIAFPVETFCLLLMMGGTDFVEKPRDLGMGTLWKAFCAGGYALLSRAVVIPSELAPARPAPNDRRPVGIIEAHLKEFYRYAYTIRLISNRVKLGLVDPATQTKRAAALLRLHEKLKRMDRARRAVAAQARKIQALEDRIGFNGTILHLIDAQLRKEEEAEAFIALSSDDDEGDGGALMDLAAPVALPLDAAGAQNGRPVKDEDAPKPDPRIAVSVEERMRRIATQLDGMRRDMEVLRRGVVDAWSLDDPPVLAVDATAAEVREHHYWSMRTSLRAMRRATSSHRDIHAAYSAKRAAAAEDAAKRNKAPSRVSQVHPFDQDELDVCCRTVVWNFHYWYHVPGAGPDAADISTALDADGVPECGWRWGETEDGRRTVQRAKRVSVSTPRLKTLATPKRKRRRANGTGRPA